MGRTNTRPGRNVKTISDDITYGPNGPNGLTTDGLRARDNITIIKGKTRYPGRIIRIVDNKTAIIARVFGQSGKLSKPYRADASAIERSTST